MEVSRLLNPARREASVDSETGAEAISAGQPYRRLAAIMFTDIVGYSTLTQRDEALALELLEEHRRLLRPLFSRYGGREIETIGDAFLIEFTSAVEACRCAVDMQKAMQGRFSAAPPDRKIQIRIGIHVGDVLFREGTILGDGVNIAARIEPLAEPGGICISEDVARQVRNKLGVLLIRLGHRPLKNIQDPPEIYRVGLPWLEAAHEPNTRSTFQLRIGIQLIDTARSTIVWSQSYERETDLHDEMVDTITKMLMINPEGLWSLRS